MYRDLTEKLLQWKNNPDHRPMLITGVRQCGKTYLMQEFCQANFEQVGYINFEKETQAAAIFDYNLDPKRILQELSSLYFGFEIVPEKTALILDEIQACPRAITSLKYFCEELRELHVLCAGSLLGVELKRQNVSFPVGKIDQLQMYPLSFAEFLKAVGSQKYMDVALNRAKDAPLPELCTEPLEKAYRDYLIIGGMPAAVNAWNQTHDYRQVDSMLDQILDDYSRDFAKHAPPSEVPKIHWIWDSVPQQLARENNKFVFSRVREGKRSSDLEDALIWLRDAGLIYQMTLVEKPELSLSFSTNSSAFKVYVSDVGLLRRKAGVDYRVLLDAMEHYDQFRGALTENYVCSQLICQGIHPYFWRSGNQAEVDFIYEHQGRVVPVEVKSAENTRAKSYRLFCKQFGVPLGFKLSLKNLAVNQEETVCTVSLPLYMIHELKRYLP